MADILVRIEAAKKVIKELAEVTKMHGLFLIEVNRVVQTLNDAAKRIEEDKEYIDDLLRESWSRNDDPL